MADVAKLAGVSHQTVSRVINDSPHVRPDTRERVLAAMRQLDYRPNSVARALVTGRSRTLGVVSFDTTLYGPASTLFGDRARRPRRGLLRQHRQPARRSTARSVLSAVERLRVQGVDGILVIAPQEAAADALRQPARRTCPLVAVEAGPGRRGAARRRRPVRRRACAPRSTCSTSATATVWHVAGPRDWLEAAAARRRLALDARGGRRRRRRRVLRRRLERALGLRARPAAGRGRPTSPRSSSPTTRWRSASCARCTRRAARSRARSASSASTTSPRRQYFTPPLTTVRQDFDEMGRRSLPLLLEQIEGGIAQPPRATTVAPELVVRASTAPARG